MSDPFAWLPQETRLQILGHLPEGDLPRAAVSRGLAGDVNVAAYDALRALVPEALDYQSEVNYSAALANHRELERDLYKCPGERGADAFAAAVGDNSPYWWRRVVAAARLAPGEPAPPAPRDRRFLNLRRLACSLFNPGAAQRAVLLERERNYSSVRGVNSIPLLDLWLSKFGGDPAAVDEAFSHFVARSDRGDYLRRLLDLGLRPGDLNRLRLAMLRGAEGRISGEMALLAEHVPLRELFAPTAFRQEADAGPGRGALVDAYHLFPLAGGAWRARLWAAGVPVVPYTAEAHAAFDDIANAFIAPTHGVNPFVEELAPWLLRHGAASVDWTLALLSDRRVDLARAQRSLEELHQLAREHGG